MNGAMEPTKCFTEDQAESIAGLVSLIIAEFEVAMGSPERVREVCARLRQRLGNPPTPSDVEQLRRSFCYLPTRSGSIVSPLFELLEESTAASKDPWPLLEGMLAVRDGSLICQAMNRILQLSAAGKFSLDDRAVRWFAEKAETEGCPIAEPKQLALLADIFRSPRLPHPESGRDPVVDIFLNEKDGKLRRLAARLLDVEGEPAPPYLSKQILGETAFQFMAQYLAFTRATHLDLLHLVPIPGEPPPSLPGLETAEDLCGPQLLRQVVSELGWERLAFGLETRRYTSVTIGNSFPLMVFPSEASLFNNVEEARRTGESFLFIAHGGIPTEKEGASGDDDIVSRFRSYNLTHSEILADILDVAPLTREKINRILKLMDSIVADFVALFSSYAEESAILPALYRELKERILAELAKETAEIQLSPELTRLVQMFEDPASLAEVRTLHGLKRYLHQKGLRLGFRLVESGRATNRTVTLMTASSKRVLLVTRDIQYVDFESSKNIQIPYSVRVLVDAFSRQTLHGQQRLPTAKIFCYGNEVHYYLSFLNHPAFLRIDYSPPLRGGMIDLEYYGVSKNELDMHPNISLEAIQQFFHQLDFDIQVDNTRVHARYDKERALGLGDICEKAEAILRLSPYFMDIDWVIGFLNIPEDARKRVSEAWARFFVLWGILPVEQLISRSRQGILVSIESGTSGETEVLWSADSPYRDRFTGPPPHDLVDKLRSFLSDLGLESSTPFEGGTGRQLGQIPLENLVLQPLRKAIEEGEIVEESGGFRKSSPDLFQRKHEAEFFAEILSAEDHAVAASPCLASLIAPMELDHPISYSTLLSSFLMGHLVAPLERSLRFQTSGSLNGFEVQRASMALTGKTLNLYVLRDGAGIIRLALFARGETLYLRRGDISSPWQTNGSIDASEFSEMLWLNNYLTPGMQSVKGGAVGEPERAMASFQRINPLQRPRPIPGDNLIEGLKASPGRAVGKVLFGTAGRAPDDFNEAILVAPSIRPEDNTFLYHSAGVVSVGGGILSHAGLIAIQFRKPALIISGKWQESASGTHSLLYTTTEYKEEERDIAGYKVTIRRDIHKRERSLSEGDLIVLDAEEGTLRVLGQDREVLGLNESLRHFGDASRHLAQITEESEILILRGRRLRARHQIERHLSHLTDLLLAHHVVQELFFGKDLSGYEGSRNEKSRFLSLLLNNPTVGEASREFIIEIARNLEHRYFDRSEEGRQRIPLSNYPHEILSLRLQVLHLWHALEETSSSLCCCGFEPLVVDVARAGETSNIARARLRAMRESLFGNLREFSFTEKPDYRLRHLVRQVQRLDMVLASHPEDQAPVDEIKKRIVDSDETVRQHLKDRLTLGPHDGGFELYSLIGWKAANLAEVERLGGSNLVPPWFVVTDRAFQEVLDSPIEKTLMSPEVCQGEGATLNDAIECILNRPDLNNVQKSRHIQQVWERINIPRHIAREVLDAYHRFWDGAGGSDSNHFVAIRSSGREEDTETATRAGEFDTFLFIRGDVPLLDHLKRAWSGLWTERAIHNRAIMGSDFQRAGGGIIVQRMVLSRVAGVLQTVNVAEDKLSEIVINAGLGLGEGIVSGTVAADLVVVAKTNDLQEAPLRFRYITADKQERVVLNERVGFGTIRAQTLYHQRLRPALEYIELVELVRIADRLEAAYGYPLDIEFGIEGARLWILQARPVGTFPAIIRETMQHYPLYECREQPGSTFAKEQAQ